MRYSRTIAWLSALLLIMVVLAGCAPRVGAGDTARAAGPDDLVVDLPSIALDVAEDGSLSLAGVPLSELGASLGLPADLALPANLLGPLTGAGVQHLQIVNQPDGLALLVNGIEIPSLGWTAESLAGMGNLMPDQPALSRLLPLLTQLGVGVTLNLPVAEGAERAPLTVDATETGAADLAAAQEEFITTVGTAPQITIPITYNRDGTWTMGGVSGDQWVNLTGQSFWTELNLTPENISAAMAAGIKDFDLNIDADGVHIAINNAALPSIDWSGGKLASVLTLLEDNGMLSALPIPREMLDQLLPILTSADINLHAIMPTE